MMDKEQERRAWVLILADCRRVLTDMATRGQESRFITDLEVLAQEEIKRLS